MEPALKQRLIGALVLVALAVIFLPMLIQGPAPESGVTDVPLDMPDAPAGQFETRDLPLIAPGATPSGGVVGLDARSPGPGEVLPTVDTAEAPGAGADDMLPAGATAGGYAVTFGSFSDPDAAEQVVRALRASQLPGYREQAKVDGWNVHRVRIGPYDSRAEAEAARLKAAHVRDDIQAQVVALDTRAAAAAVAAAPATPAPAPPKPQAPKLEPTPAPKPAPSQVAATPAPPVEEEAPAERAAPAASPTGTGFAVQLGAFKDTADANALRDRARGAGFSAFTEQVDTDKGRLTRVLVGPAIDRAAAVQLQAQVKAKFGIDGLVRSHP